MIQRVTFTRRILFSLGSESLNGSTYDDYSTLSPPTELTPLRNESRLTLLCRSFNFTSDDDDFVRIVWRKTPTLGVNATELRKNKLYYGIYCLGLNTTFAAVIPLLSLIYLNICTVLGKPRSLCTAKGCPPS